MLSHTAEHALRAIVFLAGHSEGSFSTAEIAAQSGIPASYLATILKDLARAGLVQSRRGRNGGFRLTRAASEISVLDVVRVVDQFRRIESCPLGEPAHFIEMCPLCRHLDGAVALVERVYAECTVNSLLAQPAAGGARCRFPQPLPATERRSAV